MLFPSHTHTRLHSNVPLTPAHVLLLNFTNSLSFFLSLSLTHTHAITSTNKTVTRPLHVAVFERFQLNMDGWTYCIKAQKQKNKAWPWSCESEPQVADWRDEFPLDTWNSLYLENTAMYYYLSVDHTDNTLLNSPAFSDIYSRHVYLVLLLPECIYDILWFFRSISSACLHKLSQTFVRVLLLGPKLHRPPPIQPLGRWLEGKCAAAGFHVMMRESVLQLGAWPRCVRDDTKRT